MAGPYAGPIIDPHHHLWDYGLGRHPWLAPQAGERGDLGDLASLRRNYLSADYARDAAGHAVAATVHVEAGWAGDDCLNETRWLESLDRSGNIAARYVAHVPLASRDAARLIEAQAAFSRVVGIRDILSWSEDPARRFAARGDLMRDRFWRSGLAAVQKHGLVFDLMVFGSQLGEAAALAGDFPDLTFVLEHGGSPIDRDEAGMRGWREGLRAIAAAPNVCIKISDLVAYDHDWTLASLRPVVLHCIDCFGTERAMFASDFPVAGLHASFDEVYGAFKAITAGFSRAEQSALFFDNARRVYRIEAVSAPARLAAGEEEKGQDQRAEEDAPPSR